MRRFVKRSLFCLVPVVLTAIVLGVPTAADDLGLQSVNLSCNDSTNLDLALDTTSLLALADAVSAITFFPAGDPALACGLTQSDPPPPGSGNPHYDYAVGGGDEIITGVPTCRLNFGLSAHTPAGLPMDAKGTFNATRPIDGCGPGWAGELRVEIDCLDVNGNHADMHGIVKQATGSFTGFTVGGDAWISATDIDGAALDTLGVGGNKFRSLSCGGSSESPLAHGNVSVHEAP